jgi:5S rRNA maturation endonuclease (ribonuclease M5)
VYNTKKSLKKQAKSSNFQKSILSLVEADGYNIKRKTNNEYSSPCPACGGKDRFLIWPEQSNNGKYTGGRFWCRQCSIGGDAINYLKTFRNYSYVEACSELGITINDNNIIDSYHYYNENRQLVYTVLKKIVGNEKSFPVKDAHGNWKLSENKRIPYNLPALINNSKNTIYYCEGEKDADSLVKLKYTATAFMHGKPLNQYAQYFKNRNIIILYDSDNEGIRKAIKAYDFFIKIASVKIVHLGYEFTESNGKDITDFINENSVDAVREKLTVPVDYDKSMLLKSKVPIKKKQANIKPEVGEQGDPAKGDFWYVDTNTKKMKIDRLKYKKFLEQHGYGKIAGEGEKRIYLQVDNNIVDQIDRAQIKDYSLNYLKNHDNYIQEKVELALMNSANILYSDQQLEFLKNHELKFHKKNKNESFLYFSNCILRVTKDNLEKINYNDFDYPVWKKQIINHEFKQVNWEKFEFAEFCLNISGVDKMRMESLMSAVGYMLHEYKQQSNSRAVILMDENMSVGENMGRTGKSLIGKALANVKSSVYVDDRELSRSQFALQQINFDTQIINFNDVSEKFNFKNIFAMITEDMLIEKKGGHRFTIPHADSGKILLSTNHMIKGLGTSNEARRFEVPISDYYNLDRTPHKEFKRDFFTEWGENDWSCFYSFMVSCLQKYLEKNFIFLKNENVEKNRLVAETCIEFKDFMGDLFNEGVEITRIMYDNQGTPQQIADKIELNLGLQFNRTDYLEYFKEKNSHYHKLKPNTFTKWLKAYAKIKNLEFIDSRSNSIKYGEFNLKAV